MENRIAILAVIVENPDAIEQLNLLLHEYRDGIIGRMGLPYRQRGINLISVAMDAPQTRISALSGKIGRLAGVTVKTAYASHQA
ncbi:MAG: iron-only hydrogenase system regulator [Oscillospiraceae bacterium]|nr:iron-only hydrogenase system regulator [Oscillospiraceae bacterium]